MKFKYLKGSEVDFNGADDDFLLKVGFNPSGLQLFKKGCYTVFGDSLLVVHNIGGSGSLIYTLPRQASIIAQREPIPESPRESWRCRCVDTPILKEKLGHGLDCDECNTIKLKVTNNTDHEIATSKRQEGDTVVIDMMVKDIAEKGTLYQAINDSINGTIKTAPIRIKENEIHKIKDNQAYIFEAKGREFFVPARSLAQSEEVRKFIAESKRKKGSFISKAIRDSVGDVKQLIDDSIQSTITTRGNQYGEFKSGGEIMQNLKYVMRETPNWNKLKPSQREALEMIQHKIGRILNGNPDYDDNWRDIAGYAQLILNNITGEGTK
jgi:hypothetical protein